MRLIPFALLALVLLFPADLDAREEGRIVRLPESLALTPDGTTLVFSWHGDLWRAPLDGGAARRLTFHPGRAHRLQRLCRRRPVRFPMLRQGLPRHRLAPGLQPCLQQRLHPRVGPCRRIRRTDRRDR